MGHKMRLPRFSSRWLIALGALASFPLLATGLKGQTSSRGENLTPPGDQRSLDYSAGDPIALKPVTLRERSERVSDHAKAGNVRGTLRGMRVQVEIYDPMAGTITGSGFWIGTEGLVVTCWRNVSNSPDGIMIITSETTGVKAKGKLIAQDIHKNLALIQAVPNPFLQTGGKSNSRLKAATPALDSPQLGNKLFLAVKGKDKTNFDVQAQPVSAIRPLKELGSELKILLSEVTRFGTSGEPVVNGSGKLVGILEGIYPSLDRAQWGSTEVVIPVQPILDLVKSASVPPPKGK
jgi:S1-C subfamily serine protease